MTHVVFPVNHSNTIAPSALLFEQLVPCMIRCFVSISIAICKQWSKACTDAPCITLMQPQIAKVLQCLTLSLSGSLSMSDMADIGMQMIKHCYTVSRVQNFDGKASRCMLLKWHAVRIHQLC